MGKGQTTKGTVYSCLMHGENIGVCVCVLLMCMYVCTLFSEGLAVGVGFGAIGKSPSATLENAR